ncbi:MAG TPA: hypothetical protein VFE47_20680 [Tepidisphaeraceae bacterium]|jgi:hypothetical protein|nr:hypothetical protein [Tepidisphaeraceae bacterium]
MSLINPNDFCRLCAVLIREPGVLIRRFWRATQSPAGHPAKLIPASLTQRAVDSARLN